MAENERVSNTMKDIGHEQYAQSERTSFTPGKSTSGALDQNWPVDFLVPTGNSAVDSNGVNHIRTIKLGRSIVNDQTIANPTVIGNHNRSSHETMVDGSYVYAETETQSANGANEKLTSGEEAPS